VSSVLRTGFVCMSVQTRSQWSKGLPQRILLLMMWAMKHWREVPGWRGTNQEGRVFRVGGSTAGKCYSQAE
jgi:hypothetical protein